MVNKFQTYTEQFIIPNAVRWDQEQMLPKSVLQQGVNINLGSLYTQKSNGGLELGSFDSSLVYEQLGFGCNSTAFFLSIHNMCNKFVDKFGTDIQKQKWCQKLNTFDLIGSYCLTETNSGSDSAKMQTFAQDCGDHFIVNGQKAFITGAGYGGLYITILRTGEDEISCLGIEKETEGISFETIDYKLGWRNFPLGYVTFKNCIVPKENLIGQRGSGFKIAMTGLDNERVMLSSMGVGTASRALQLTIENFGNSQSQNIRFKIAELTTQLESVRQLTRTAAKMMDNNYSNRTFFSSMAKHYSAQHCNDIIDQLSRLNGEQGILASFGLEKMLRDIRNLHITGGTSEIMKHIISRKIFD